MKLSIKFSSSLSREQNSGVVYPYVQANVVLSSEKFMCDQTISAVRLYQNAFFEDEWYLTDSEGRYRGYFEDGKTVHLPVRCGRNRDAMAKSAILFSQNGFQERFEGFFSAKKPDMAMNSTPVLFFDRLEKYKTGIYEWYIPDASFCLELYAVDARGIEEGGVATDVNGSDAYFSKVSVEPALTVLSKEGERLMHHDVGKYYHCCAYEHGHSVPVKEVEVVAALNAPTTAIVNGVYVFPNRDLYGPIMDVAVLPEPFDKRGTICANVDAGMFNMAWKTRPAGSNTPHDGMGVFPVKYRELANV